ncbi:alkane hydroxylase MAH1 [Spinacia oleracea]|uniref:Alkane hydroxylase MAH1 n=1 Tax=Spinacia oleracea TaxID=3562 RepID=A0A9R0JL01_SPIOL|nr:alkane hydroxylase MAH1-like [Spinacia oleracea]
MVVPQQGSTYEYTTLLATSYDLTMEYVVIFIPLFPLLLLCCYFLRRKNRLPTNWPLLGMFPAVLKNVHRIHDYFIEVMENSHSTFFFKGPWFTNMYVLATVDPANVNHVMSKNFGNYPKGSKLKEMLDILGDGVANCDSLVWKYHRKIAQSFFHHPKFHEFLVNNTWDKLESGLIPVLDHASKNSIEVDLQDLFQRFTFDTICIIAMDHDPGSLSIDSPFIPSSKALDDVEEVFFSRHAVPSYVWKFKRWLDIGDENKYRKAWKILDNFIYKFIALKRETLSKEKSSMENEDVNNEVSTDLLTLYIKQDENYEGPIDFQSEKFLRDTILNYFLAGRDTTSATLSWFFYLLFKNPPVASKIKKELENITINRGNFKEVSNKLVYFHSALCETLRLYPPVVFEVKSPVEADILPSGHHVNPDMQIIFNMYAMGRMKSIWGDDCYEFKPERWISEQGKIRHEPSYKFLAFNAGPRTCIGKDMAFTQMKIIVITIIQNYVIEVVDEHRVVPSISMIFRMKYGFKVRIRRSR